MNKSKDSIDIISCKKEKLILVNHVSKSEYFNKVSNAPNSKPFWNTCKPYFPNKDAHGGSKIMLIVKNKILSKMRNA